jgi:hypothetical protein
MFIDNFDKFVTTFFLSRKSFYKKDDKGEFILDDKGKKIFDHYEWDSPVGLAAAALRRWGIPTRHWKEYKDYLIPIAEFIWHTNAISHYDDMVDNREFDMIEIPDEFKALVFPKGVYLNPLIQPSKDLLDRPKGLSLAELQDKYQAYKAACEAWRYKSPQDFQSTGHFTKLSDLKTEVAITSIESRLEVRKKVDFNGTDGFIPIPVLNTVYGLYNDYKFNDSPEYAIQEYINNFKF